MFVVVLHTSFYSVTADLCIVEIITLLLPCYTNTTTLYSSYFINCILEVFVINVVRTLPLKLKTLCTAVRAAVDFVFGISEVRSQPLDRRHLKMLLVVLLSPPRQILVLFLKTGHELSMWQLPHAFEYIFLLIFPTLYYI